MIRDPKYLRWIKTQRCLFSGQPPSDFDPTDPMHIGTAGKGLKSPDNEVLPIAHSLHVLGHAQGEVSMLRKYAPDDVLRMAFQALGRELYAEYKAENSDAA